MAGYPQVIVEKVVEKAAKKELGKASLTVKLKVTNNYEHAIRKVRVIENTSEYFVVGDEIKPSTPYKSKAGVQWFIDKIKSNTQRVFSVRIGKSPKQKKAKPPYPVDGMDTVVGYLAEEFQFEIANNDPNFSSFETDLMNDDVSLTTQQVFAKHPNPPDHYFSIQLGNNQISKQTPDPAFQWAIEAVIVHSSPVSWIEDVQLLVKKTDTGYKVYRTVSGHAKPPQQWVTP